MNNFSSLRPGLRALALFLACVIIAGAVRLSAPVFASIPPEATPPVQERYFSKEALARGKFLVASEKIREGHFARSVILLTDYGWHGAVGIIINKPTEAVPARVLPYVKGLEKMEDSVWFGGPVDPGQVTMLIRSKKTPDASMRILPGLYASTSIETLAELIKEKKAGSFRLYAGYAGWAPQQLELEVAQGGWYVMEAGSDEVFDVRDAEVWERLMEKGGLR